MEEANAGADGQEVLHSSRTAWLTILCSAVPHPNSNPAHSLHASDSGGQFWTEQAGVGGPKSNSSDRRKPEVNGSGRVLLLLEIDPVTQNYGAVECETRFRAVSLDEVGDSTIIGTLAAFRREAI